MATKLPIMLTIREVAERLKLPEHFIRKLCWENKIVYIKAGNKYLINFRKLIDYLNKEDEYSVSALLADAH